MATENDILQAINTIENVDTLRTIFQSVATALRNKGVNQNPIYPSDFARLISGIETGTNISDATATSDDVALGKIFYGKNGRMVGNLSEIKYGVHKYNDSTIMLSDSEIELRKSMTHDILFRQGSVISLSESNSLLGDATAADIVEGKTATSKNGLKISGTARITSGLEPFYVEINRSDYVWSKIFTTTLTFPIELPRYYAEKVPTTSQLHDAYDNFTGICFSLISNDIDNLKAYSGIKLIAGYASNKDLSKSRFVYLDSNNVLRVDSAGLTEVAMMTAPTHDGGIAYIHYPAVSFITGSNTNACSVGKFAAIVF